MDTQTLNNTPTNGIADDKSDKMKKVVVESAKFAAAAGLGVAGTMAANAMNRSEDASEESQSEPHAQMAHDEGAVEEQVENVTDFNHNDIMIEEVEEVIVGGSSVNSISSTQDAKQALYDIEELQPITGENIDADFDAGGVEIAIVDVDDPANVEIIVESESEIITEEILEDPDWETFNEDSGNLLASEDFSDPDVLNDILA